MSNPLLLTKFHVPFVRASLVKRDRLIERLNQGIKGKLVAISAPAGFGKTTLLCQWLHQAKMQAIWLSLDAADNAPTSFWTYIVTALQQSYPNIGEGTLAMLRSREVLSWESLLIPLINELAGFPHDCVLVLDDFHAISSRPICEAISFFLEHLPPQIHLAIASRSTLPIPLARLRSRGLMVELQAIDLRFTVAETSEFIEQTIDLPLSPADVQIIQARTEGWIASLQLAANAMRDGQDISAFIAALKGSQQYILDYLIEEVLERQPKERQLFLLRTSILARMCSALCAAVVGDEAIASTDLEQLAHLNLFVVPLDNDRQWYRYHHLFRELLQDRLHRTEPKQISEYHRRAAQWYEQQGYIAAAIEHAIASQSFSWAVALIAQEAQSANPQIEPATMLKFIETLPPDLVCTNPWLCLAYGWALYSCSQFEAAAATIQTIERLLEQDATLGDSRLWGLVTAFKGMQARHQGAISESVTLMEQALQQLPPENSWLRAMLLLNLGVTYFVADNFAAAKKLLPEVSKIGQIRGLADPAIAGLYLQGQFLALRGRMQQAIALCQQGFDLAKQRGWLSTYAGVLVQVALGDLLREQNQLETAAWHLTESIARAMQTQQPGLMMGYITLARVRQAQGDLAAAREAIRAAEQCQPWLWATILSVAACKARLDLAQGNLEEAIAWVEESTLKVDDELRYSTTNRHPCGSELDYLTLARVLIARGRLAKASNPYLDDAISLLDRLYAFIQSGNRQVRVMEVLMLKALVWQARGDLEKSLHLLEQAIALVPTGDYVRLFVDEGEPMAELLRHIASRGIQLRSVSCLLVAFGQVKGESNKLLIEPLSSRELEVLHHLAQGFPNRAIARQLFVSIAAVKWHARNIYGKLNVSNRTQAVVRARELGILK